jgi:hypothetical protein
LNGHNVTITQYHVGEIKDVFGGVQPLKSHESTDFYDTDVITTPSKMSAPMKNASSLGKLVFERSSFLNEKEKHKERIVEHSFNSSVSLILHGIVFY